MTVDVDPTSRVLYVGERGIGRSRGNPLALLELAAGLDAAQRTLAASTTSADPALADPTGGALAESFDTARHGLRLLTALGHPDLTATVPELALYRLLHQRRPGR